MMAMVHMEPLDGKKKQIFPPKLAGMTPRDGLPHRVSCSWETDPNLPFPHYVRIYADRRDGGIFEVKVPPPVDWRKLDRFTLTQILTVLPRKS